MVVPLPSLLLVSFLAAVVLMLLGAYCAISIVGIARKFLNDLYKSDVDSYDRLVGADKSSWIEKKSDSISDGALWWKLYQLIYQGGDDRLAIDSTVHRRFALRVRLMFSSFLASLCIAIFVILVGLRLSS